MATFNHSCLFMLLCRLLLLQQVRGLSYWIDESCKKHNSVEADSLKLGTSVPFQQGLTDAKYLAGRAAERIRDSSDTNQNNLFNFFFRVPRTNAAQLARVTSVYDAINTMQELGQGDRARSDVRFYCDNDPMGAGQRWQERPDDPSEPEPNSQKALGHDKEYRDVINKVRRNTKSLGCQNPGTVGETFSWKVDNPRDENPRRSVISICPRKLGTGSQVSDYRPPWTLADFLRLEEAKGHEHQFNIDMGSGEGVNQAFKTLSSWVLSLTFLHELIHIDYPAFQADANVPDEKDYAPINGMTAAVAASTPEVYVFYAISARLADHHFTVDYNAAAHFSQGIVRYDPDLPNVPSTLQIPQGS